MVSRRTNPFWSCKTPDPKSVPFASEIREGVLHWKPAAPCNCNGNKDRQTLHDESQKGAIIHRATSGHHSIRMPRHCDRHTNFSLEFARLNCDEKVGHTDDNIAVVFRIAASTPKRQDGDPSKRRPRTRSLLNAAIFNNTISAISLTCSTPSPCAKAKQPIPNLCNSGRLSPKNWSSQFTQNHHNVLYERIFANPH